MKSGDGAIISTFSGPRRGWEQRPVQRGSPPDTTNLVNFCGTSRPTSRRSVVQQKDPAGAEAGRQVSNFLRLRGGLNRSVGRAMQGSDDNLERLRSNPALLRCSMAWHLVGRRDVLARAGSSRLGRPRFLPRSTRSCSFGGVDDIIGTYTGRVPRVWMVLGYLGSHGAHV